MSWTRLFISRHGEPSLGKRESVAQGCNKRARLKIERGDRVTDVDSGREKRSQPVEHQRLDIARRNAHSFLGSRVIPSEKRRVVAVIAWLSLWHGSSRVLRTMMQAVYEISCGHSTRGTVRVACPPGLLPNVLTSMLPGFVAAYPEVRLALAVSNRRVDLVEDGFDVAIRVRERLDTSAPWRICTDALA
jgi:hypothetical protein